MHLESQHCEGRKMNFWSSMASLISKPKFPIWGPVTNNNWVNPEEWLQRSSSGLHTYKNMCVHIHTKEWVCGWGCGLVVEDIIVTVGGPRFNPPSKNIEWVCSRVFVLMTVVFIMQGLILYKKANRTHCKSQAGPKHIIHLPLPHDYRCMPSGLGYSTLFLRLSQC